jgi:hypothetical protein
MLWLPRERPSSIFLIVAILVVTYLNPVTERVNLSCIKLDKLNPVVCLVLFTLLYFKFCFFWI